MKRITIAGCIFVMLGAPVHGQVPACPSSGAPIARPCELDQRPLPETRWDGPRYPDILRQAGVTGDAHVRFVVDSSGRSDVSTFEVLRATHQLFATAVRNVLPRQLFDQPRRAGMLTRVQMEEVVSFVHPLPGWRSARENIDPVRSVDSTGRLLTMIYAFTPSDSLNLPAISEIDSLDIFEAAVNELMKEGTIDKPPKAWCLQLAGGDPPPGWRMRWRPKGIPVARVDDCPKTYTTMIRARDDRRPPRGWIDPATISVDSIIRWNRTTVLLESRTHQGTMTAYSQCEVILEAKRWMRAFCVTTRHSIS